MIPETYKTLVFKEQSNYREKYAIIFSSMIGETSVPQLLKETASMEALKSVFPKLDFSEVELITLKITQV